MKTRISKKKEIAMLKEEIQALRAEIESMKKSHANEMKALIESYEMKISANQDAHEAEVSVIKNEHEDEMHTANGKIAKLQKQVETQVEENERRRLQNARERNSILIRKLTNASGRFGDFVTQGGATYYSNGAFTDGVTNYDVDNVLERMQMEIENSKTIFEMFPNTTNVLDLYYKKLNANRSMPQNLSPIEVLEYVNNSLDSVLTNIVVEGHRLVTSYFNQISVIANHLTCMHHNVVQREELEAIVSRGATDKFDCMLSFDTTTKNLKKIQDLCMAVVSLTNM